MAHSDIPVLDFFPFLREGDENGKKKGMEVIRQACSELGIFQIVNHGVPLDSMSQALELCSTFFGYPDEEKLNCSGGSCGALPLGYGRSPHNLADKYEYLLMLSPESSYNVYPKNPPELRSVLEDVYCRLSKTGLLMESIINDCLGLPPNLLKEFNHDRNWDIMSAKHYLPAYDNDNIGFSGHQDGNYFTFLLQDQIGGLQAHMNGEWVPVVPAQGRIVVNIGDIIQVLSNNKFKSSTHRVVRTKGRSRCSIAFFYNLPGDKWVEPLPQFTTKTNPPSSPKDVIDITHYKITT